MICYAKKSRHAITPDDWKRKVNGAVMTGYKPEFDRTARDDLRELYKSGPMLLDKPAGVQLEPSRPEIGVCGCMIKWATR